MQEDYIRKVLGFLSAAQTVLAIYSQSEHPDDAVSCCRVVSELLEDPDLLKAQISLAFPDRTFDFLPGGSSGISMPSGWDGAGRSKED